VLANFPEVQVERYLLNFEGVWHVPAERDAASELLVSA